MMTSDDKVGGWVKKGQKHDDVILEWSLIKIITNNQRLRTLCNCIAMGHKVITYIEVVQGGVSTFDCEYLAYLIIEKPIRPPQPFIHQHLSNPASFYRY